MDLGPPRRKAAADNTIPLINIVFLMLIFFLFAGTLSRDDAREIRPPFNPAVGEAIASAGALVVDHEGAMLLHGRRVSIQEVLEALERPGEPSGKLVIAADGELVAGRLKPLLGRLTRAGVEVVLLTSRDAR